MMQNVDQCFTIIASVAHVWFNLVACPRLLIGAMPGHGPLRCHRFQWFVDEMLKMDWMIRHLYYNHVLALVSRRRAKVYAKAAKELLGPDQFLYGQRTGKAPPTVIALKHIEASSRGKRQMLITEFFGPPVKRPRLHWL